MSLDKRKAIQKATALIQEGKLQEAIAEYEAILRADPSDPSQYNTLGDLHARIGSSSEAIACYLKFIEALRGEGLRFRAIALYKKIIKLEPDNLDALRACADLYAEEGLRAEAKHQYLSAAERALKLGLDRMALELYERLSHVEPGDPSIAARLALLLAGGGRRSEAADLLGRLAMEARTKGRHDDARLLYQQMVQTCPEMFTGWYCLGRLEFETGRLREAEEHLQRASEIDPSSPLPHLLLGHLYQQQGRRDSAKAAWQALLRLDPDHTEARHLLGQLYLSEGESEAAVREFDAVARSLSDSGDLDRGIALLGELGPSADHPLIQERLGELLARSERMPEAKAAFTRAAELYLLAGRNDEQGRLLRRIIVLDPDEAHVAAALAQGPTDEDVPVVVLDEAPESAVAVRSEEAKAGWSQERTPDADGETPWILDAEDQGDLGLFQVTGEEARSSVVTPAGDGDDQGIEAVEPQGIEDADSAEVFSAVLAEIESDEPIGQEREAPAQLPPIDRSVETGDAHYQLGMAYREMGLLDDAIAEFRRSAMDDRLRLLARHMVGRCLLAKGAPEAAIHEMSEGLSIAGRPPEEYLAVKYDLATAYQSAGDLVSAKAILRELEAESPSFRDVASRAMRLQAQLDRGAAGGSTPHRRTYGARGKGSS
ncbi:MAG: tetratricopeptide repeat protein [Candidatus Methylomirabilaceae bacterium]